jgi:hypothetical protein
MCFGPGGGKGAGQPAVDVKLLHAKIGELTLPNARGVGVDVDLHEPAQGG